MAIVASIPYADIPAFPDVPPLVLALLGDHLPPVLDWFTARVYGPMFARCADHPLVALKQEKPGYAHPQHRLSAGPTQPAHHRRVAGGGTRITKWASLRYTKRHVVTTWRFVRELVGPQGIEP
ncbi:hypothetical protein EKD04_005665 [Chloroflexales bacterium ZM16-3]|nr:hypothetical protein [Chloroflexales bacterium ZM16-3]